MPSDRSVEPREVAEMVERYVTKALDDARQYDNSTPLDESGVYEMHLLAAKIYALGFDDGDMVATIRTRGERARERDAEAAKEAADV